MKICISSEGKTLDSKVDPRFGRCRNFIFIDTETGHFEIQENSHSQFQGGSGIQSAQLVVSKGAQAILTGNIGPNAHQVLSTAGISVFSGVSGTVKEAIADFKNGKYQPADASNVDSKFGVQNQ